MTKYILFSLFLALTLSPAVFGAMAADQQIEEAQLDPAAKAYMKAATVGLHHEHLKKFAGTWDITVKHYMGSGEPTVSHGVDNVRVILDGRFILSEFRGEYQGKVFKGIGVLGYDNTNAQHNTFWVDSMGTAFMVGSGTCDGKGNRYEFTDHYPDPMTKKDHITRRVIRFLNADEYLEEFYDTNPEGKEFKVMELHSKRRITD